MSIQARPQPDPLTDLGTVTQPEPQPTGLLTLPNECLEHIVQFGDRAIMYAFSLVSRRLNLIANPILYRKLEFPSYAEGRLEQCLQTLTQSVVLASYVRHFEVPPCPVSYPLDPGILWLIAKSIKNMTRLEVFTCGDLGPEIMAALCRFPTFTFKRLGLDIRGPGHIQPYNISPLIGLPRHLFPNAVQLRLRDHDDGELPAPFVAAIMHLIASSAPLLRSLTLEGFWRSHEWHTRLATYLASIPGLAFPLLEELFYVEEGSLGLPCFSNTLNLRTLWCSLSYPPPGGKLVALPPNAFPALTSLNCRFDTASVICADRGVPLRPINHLNLHCGKWPTWTTELADILRNCPGSVVKLRLWVDEVYFPQAFRESLQYMHSITELEVCSGDDMWPMNHSHLPSLGGEFLAHMPHLRTFEIVDDYSLSGGKPIYYDSDDIDCDLKQVDNEQLGILKEWGKHSNTLTFVSFGACGCWDRSSGRWRKVMLSSPDSDEEV